MGNKESRNYYLIRRCFYFKISYSDLIFSKQTTYNITLDLHSNTLKLWKHNKLGHQVLNEVTKRLLKSPIPFDFISFKWKRCIKMKKKKKYHTVWKVPKLDIKIVERGKTVPLIHKCMTPHLPSLAHSLQYELVRLS